jgi:hypothetical protein
MDENRCPRCGWPLDELPASTVARGRGTDYLHCVCGSWVVCVGGVVVGSTLPVTKLPVTTGRGG